MHHESPKMCGTTKYGIYKCILIFIYIYIFFLRGPVITNALTTGFNTSRFHIITLPRGAQASALHVELPSVGQRLGKPAST